MKLILLISAFLFFAIFSSGQSADAYEGAIARYIAALNAQDYRAVKKQLDPVGRMLISRRKLRKQFGAFFEKNGPGEIVNTVRLYGNVYTADIAFGNRQSANKHVYYQFNFNDKQQVNGFGYGFPTFRYKTGSKTALPDKAALQAIIARYREQDGRPFNGCVLMAKGGAQLVNYSGGYADELHKSPNTDSTLFQLASCSKTFTALAILRLADEGRLSVDDPVSKYLPGFPYAEVRIRNLLSHTSGIPDYQGYIEKYLPGNEKISNTDIVGMYAANSIPLRFAPETQFGYSNANYIILAALAEKVSGDSFGEYLASHVLRPLGLEDTRFYNTRRSGETLSNFAIGYVREDGRYQVPDSLEKYSFVVRQDALAGDDNVCSTPLEMIAFMKIFEQQDLISDSLMARMRAPYRLSDGSSSNYGYGLGVINEAGNYALYMHTGSWPGYLTCFYSIPEENIRLVILSNFSNERIQFMADDLLQAVLDKPAD
jgi:CubicO group peptidase (beta-lactamase class C family)